MTAKLGNDKGTRNFVGSMQADCCNSGDFYNPFPNYAFTGSVRPMYPLSDRRKVPDHIPRPDYAEDGKYIIAIGTAV